MGLVQLHKLAGQGSRRARAEIERRLHVAPGPDGSPPPQAPRTDAPTMTPLAPRAPLPADGAAAPAVPPIDAWQGIERHAQQASRAAGPPRLLGLVLTAWGVLLALGGLALLARTGSAYYLGCGLACAGVGALLWRQSRWAIAAHGVAVLIALAWAWRSGVALALVQAAPLWIAALWLAVPAVREPLE